MANKALSYFKSISFLTNGVLFNDKIYDFIRNNISSVGIQISIDGYTEETNSKIRGATNTFNKTINTIQKLIELNASLTVTYMLTNENMHELLLACESLKVMNLKRFSISIPENIGRGASKDLYFSPIRNYCGKFSEELYRIVEAVNAKYDSMLIHSDKILNDIPSLKISNCGAGWKLAAIYPDGDVLACQNMGKTIKLGNVFKDDLDMIFGVNPLTTFLSNFAIQRDNENCKKCKYQYFCGSCLMKIIIANKELLRNGYDLCPIAIQNHIAENIDLKDTHLVYNIF